MLEKVLLIDEHPSTVEFIQKCLPDFRFSYTDNYDTALEILKNDTISLIILDYNINNNSGLEILENLQHLQLGIGIIMCALKATKAEIIDSLESGADAFIEKPINMRVLEQKIQKILIKTHYNIERTQSTKQKIKSFQTYLDSNSQNKVTLKDISEKNHFSYKYFSRRFKEEIGISFSEYRLEQKLNRAKELLKNDALSVTQISEILGYMNPSAFMKIFKQKTGQTPSQFRKEALQAA